MTDYKVILGFVSSSIALLSYVWYFYGIYKGEIKPHAFTWFVWGTISLVGFAAVLTAGGAAGSWVIGVNIIGCYTVAAIGFWQRHVKYDLYDWIALTGALCGMLLWQLTKNPLYAVLLVSLSDAIAFIPTYRKAYRLPYEEQAASFAFGISYYVLAILALESYTITTWFYHAAVIAGDAGLVALILFRRKQLKP